MKIAVSLVALALLAGGCVTQGKYDALQSTLNQTKKKSAATVKQRDAAIAKLQAELKAAVASIAARDKAVARLTEQIAALTTEGEAKSASIKKLQAELAGVLKDRTSLRQSAAELKKALAELSKRRSEAEARVKQFKDLLARFKTLIDAGKLKVKIADGRMVLELPTDVLFQSGQAKLSDEGGAAVKEVAGVLVTLPKKRRFQVEGHTDNVPIKTSRFPSNWQLASARALNVVQAMMEAGMSGDRISAAGFGEYRPVSGNDTDEGKASNRRIEIVMVPDLSSLPGFNELQSAVGGK
jgi:chemotaxis protein MotB